VGMIPNEAAGNCLKQRAKGAEGSNRTETHLRKEKSSAFIHNRGRSPLRIRICTAGLLDVDKALLDVGHSYGRSPLCARVCFTRSPDCEKSLPHI
jgi:hypothetical protein